MIIQQVPGTFLGTGAEIYQAGFVVDVPGGHTAKT